MYPMALMCLSAAEEVASFPHVLVSSWSPPVPNPILESHWRQSYSLLPRTPTLTLDISLLLCCLVLLALNPSLLQFFCKEPRGLISNFHVSRPSEVLRYCPSAINECRELAFLLITINLVWLSILIPRQILVKDVFQYVGSLVSCESNPVFPPSRLKASLFVQKEES